MMRGLGLLARPDAEKKARPERRKRMTERPKEKTERKERRDRIAEKDTEKEKKWVRPDRRENERRELTVPVDVRWPRIL